MDDKEGVVVAGRDVADCCAAAAAGYCCEEDDITLSSNSQSLSEAFSMYFYKNLATG